MTEADDRRHRVTKWMRWIARVWSLPIVVWALLLFGGYAWSWVTTGVADPHAVEDVPLLEALPPIFLLLSALGLGLAWRWERLGGTISAVCALVALALLVIDRPPTQDFARWAIPYLLSVIVAIPGILFLICWRRSR